MDDLFPITGEGALAAIDGIVTFDDGFSAAARALHEMSLLCQVPPLIGFGGAWLEPVTTTDVPRPRVYVVSLGLAPAAPAVPISGSAAALDFSALVTRQVVRG
jgi:hypothetical protein